MRYISLCFVVLTAPSLLAQINEFQGQTASGAYYSIAVPSGWQTEDGLVIWNHGYQGYTTTSPESDPSLGPLEDIVLAQGFAVAASSYSQTGWALFNSHTDNQQLYEKFVELIAVPEKLFIQGASLGGIVSVRDLESGLLPDIDGALLLCGAVAGPENWYEAFDLRMIYEAVCDEVEEAGLPTRNWYDQPLQYLGEIQFLNSLQRCTGILANTVFDNPLWPLLLDDGQRQRLSKILQLTNTEAEFLLLNLGYAVFELPSLVNNTDKLNGRRPFGNVGIDYGDDNINRLVQRSAALPSSRDLLQANYSPSGDIANTKIVSIHTNRDGLVRVENQKSLIDKMPAEQLTSAVVIESSPTHCGFSDNEGLAAWNSLLQWSEGGAQPNATDIQNECQRLDSDAQHCRFHPNYSYKDSLLSFPRSRVEHPSAFNSFNNSSGLVSIPSLQQTGDSSGYAVELMSLQEDDSLYAIRTIEPVIVRENWQHKARYFPDESLLYVPGLQVLPLQENDESFNVFMRYKVQDGQEVLQLLEYEPAD